MKSNNIRKLILCIIAAILIPLRVSGAAYWQGNNVLTLMKVRYGALQG